MAFTTYTVTGNIGAGFDGDVAARLKLYRVWAEPSNDVAADSVSNQVRLGAIDIDVDESGHFVATLPATNQTGAPAGWTIVIRYSQPPKLSNLVDRRLGPFELEANREFAAIVNNGFISLVPVNEETIASVTDLRDETKTYRDQTVAVGNTNDTIIAGRIADPASATYAGLTATIVRTTQPALRVLVDGDSTAAQMLTDATAQVGGSQAGTYDAYSAFNHATVALSGRIIATTNRGVGGQRSGQILARIADSANDTYDVALLSFLVNDLYDGTGTTVADMKANTAAIWQAHLARGKQVVHVLPGPSRYATATPLANHYEMLRWARDYARDHPGIHLVDGYVVAADPTDGLPLAYFCRPGDDASTPPRGVHPGYPWASKLGLAIADAVEPLLARIPILESPSNADARNVLTNGRMLGSSSGLATGYSVVKPDGSTATFTASKVARADKRPGEVQQIVIPSASWATELPALFIQDTNPGGRWAVGDTVRAVVHFETDPDTIGAYPSGINLGFWNGLGGVTGAGKRGNDSSAPHAIPAGLDLLPRRGRWFTPWGVVPASTGRLQLRVPLPYGTTRILSTEIQKAA